MERDILGKATAWAQPVMPAYLDARREGGGVKPDTFLGGRFRQEADQFNRSACASLKKLVDVINRESKGETAERRRSSAMKGSDNMISEGAMAVLARQPARLPEIDVTTWGRWPSFMLTGERPPQDSTFTGSQDDLAHFKPEYLDGVGGLRFPMPGSPDHETFQDWYLGAFADNRLYEIALYVTQQFQYGGVSQTGDFKQDECVARFH
jgi:hypothetical protein